ncbi:MAG: NAD(P)H-hydrate dehydratase [Clostridia bacterium]|nr:NAD(P)H-hydrate dehydratase [Clostridia bacterium]
MNEPVTLTKNYVSGLLPKRKRNTHKGDYGKAAIVGGSEAYTGAAYLSAAACVRSGAGYTALFVPETIFPYYVLKIPEVLLKKQGNPAELLSYDSIAYGMGMGVSREVADGAVWLVENYAGKLILDADALNSLAKYENIAALFSRKQCDVLLTPHVKEFSRLSGESVEEILKKGLTAAEAFSERHGVGVLLKNAYSAISCQGKTLVNTRGTAGQAKGGTGDVLSGVIAGLCASGLSLFDGACAGAYAVGLAAELAGEKISEYSLLASDLISYMGRAFLRITENTDKECGEE